jgi:acrylyl-CoA reductase (NADPH)
VRLLGVESVLCPPERRLNAWGRLARDLPLDLLDTMIQVVPLEAVTTVSREIVAGRVRGRTVVQVSAPPPDSD